MCLFTEFIFRLTKQYGPWILMMSITNIVMIRPVRSANGNLIPVDHPPGYEKLEARVGPYKGRNVFFVNGEPVPPLMYSSTEQGRKTWADPTRQCIIDFTEQGYDIIQTDMWFK